MIINTKKSKEIYNGELVLQLPVGSILKVLDQPKRNDNGNEIVIIVCVKSPFDKKLVSMTTGIIWGGSLKNYSFELLFKHDEELTLTKM